MNANELKAQIESRLNSLNRNNFSHQQHSPKKQDWTKPLALAATGATCLGVAASLPLVLPSVLPAFGASLAGATAGVATGIKIGAVGVAALGGGIGIPAAVVSAILGGSGAIVSGATTWLTQLAFAVPSIWSIILSSLGVFTLAISVAWAGYLLWCYARNPICVTAAVV